MFGWTAGIISLILSGGACLAYATGYDEVIYRTITNWTSDIFVYLFAKGIEYFVSSVDLLPDFSFGQYQSAAVYALSFLALANTIFPIIELVRSFVWVLFIYLALIAFRIMFKIVPGLSS